MQGGGIERLTLPGVAAAEPLLPRIRALLGVLGTAAEVGGVEASAAPGAARSAAGALAVPAAAPVLAAAR